MRNIINERRLGAITAFIMLAFAGNAWGITIQANADNNSLSPSDERWFQYFESRFPAGPADELASGTGFDGEQNHDWSAAWFDRIGARFDQRSGNRSGRAGARSGGRVGQALWLEMMREQCTATTDCRLARWLESKQVSWTAWNNHANGTPPQDNNPPTASPVPVPAPLLLFVSGLVGLTGFLRRGKVAAQP